jgi:hypothetical protein
VASKSSSKEVTSAAKTVESQKLYFTVQMMAVKKDPLNYKELVKEYGLNRTRKNCLMV